MKKLFYIILLFVFVAIGNALVNADTRPVTGSAWSASSVGGVRTGVGWISMNGSSPDYGVEVEDEFYTCADGTLCYDAVGEAWSDNIGWIKFGGLSGFPDGISGKNARINNAGTPTTVADDYLEGWARACSVYASGCSGALADNYYRGGWDGWIKLSDGSNYKAPVNARTGNGNGFWNSVDTGSWGATILGWVGWDISLADPQDPYECVDGQDNNDSEDILIDSADPGCEPPYELDDDERDPPGVIPTVELFIGPATVATPALKNLTMAESAIPRNVNFRWNVTNAISCTSTWGEPITPDPILLTASGIDTHTVTPTVGKQTFSVTCINGSNSKTANVTITVSDITEQ